MFSLVWRLRLYRLREDYQLEELSTEVAGWIVERRPGKRREWVRLRVQREERGIWEREGVQRDDVGKSAKRGSPPHTPFKNSLCRESRLALHCRRRRRCAVVRVIPDPQWLQHPLREIGYKSFRPEDGSEGLVNRILHPVFDNKNRCELLIMRLLTSSGNWKSAVRSWFA